MICKPSPSFLEWNGSRTFPIEICKPIPSYWKSPWFRAWGPPQRNRVAADGSFANSRSMWTPKPTTDQLEHLPGKKKLNWFYVRKQSSGVRTGCASHCYWWHSPWLLGLVHPSYRAMAAMLFLNKNQASVSAHPRWMSTCMCWAYNWDITMVTDPIW